MTDSSEQRPWKPTHHLTISVYKDNGRGGKGDFIEMVDEDVMELPGDNHPDDSTRPGKWYQRACEVHQPDAENDVPDIAFYSYPEKHMQGQGSWMMYSQRFQDVVYDAELKRLSSNDSNEADA